MKKILTMGLFALASSLFFGCDRVEDTVDCAGICDRYKSCFDENYDVAACTQRCMEEADKSAAYSDRVQSCADCIDDKACAAATFECGTQCAGIVP